jgi:transcriptional regulator with XRE-family HTH domain
MRADLIDSCIDSCNLQAFRLRLGLAQDEMAALLAVVAWECLGERAEPNGNMVSKWERGVKAPGRLYRNCYRILRGSTREQLATYISALACGTVEGMNRRQVLGVGFALGAAALLPDQLLSAQEGQVPDPPEVAALGGVLLRYDASPAQRAGELESCGLNTLGGRPRPCLERLPRVSLRDAKRDALRPSCHVPGCGSRSRW